MVLLCWPTQKDLPVCVVALFYCVRRPGWVYDIHNGYHVVEVEKFIGQFVVIKNLKGTCNINQPTLSIVGLENIVSLQSDSICFCLQPSSPLHRDFCKITTTQMQWISMNINFHIIYKTC